MANNAGGAMISLRQLVLGIVAVGAIALVVIALYANKGKLTIKADEDEVHRVLSLTFVQNVNDKGRGSIIFKDIEQKISKRYCTPKGTDQKILLLGNIVFFAKNGGFGIFSLNRDPESDIAETTDNLVGFERIVTVSGDTVTETNREVYYTMAGGTKAWISKEAIGDAMKGGPDVAGYNGLLRRNSETTTYKCLPSLEEISGPED